MRGVLVGLLLVGCGPTPTNSGSDAATADGASDADTNDGARGDAGTCAMLIATHRDFHPTHPDFEKAQGDDRALAKSTLGGDHKPVYAPAGATLTVSGPASFDTWYRDVAGTNLTLQRPMPLVEDPPGTYTFDDQDFFPLDGAGFGNEGNPHNFHFTTEIHATFAYHGGERFEFTGDDDVWVFVNNRLALDLGGVHGPETGALDFDASAAVLGIQKGNRYAFDVFHAERHTTESHFRMVTTIDCFIF